MTNTSRPPAVAGMFYPDSAEQLTAQINGYLQLACHDNTRQPKVLIVPHAGYIYSGAVAASAFSILQAHKKITRIILLGPAHTMYLQACALPASTEFTTPLGNIPLDITNMQRINTHFGVIVSDEAHSQEHSLEVELPFLQICLDSFELLPMVVGDIEASLMADILELVWGGDETLIVASSDLSHFHTYAQANKIDEQTCLQILNFNSQITGEQACGHRAINAVALVAKRHQLNIKQLSYQNSGDTGGDKNRVVGYASFALY